MPRLALATIVAALSVAAGILAGSGGLSAAAVETLLLPTGVAAVMLAAFAALLSLYAVLRVGRTQADVDRLARSVDGALRRMAEGNERHATTVGTLADTVNREIGGMIERLSQGSEPPAPSAAPPEMGGNVVPLAARGRTTPQDFAESTAAAAYVWTPETPIEICLQPIIDISKSTAAGFEVFARLILPDGGETMVSRMHGDRPPLDLARFERAMVLAAVAAMRRQLGATGRDLPLHVPVSSALLGDMESVREIVDLLRLYPASAAALVLSLPAAHLTGPARRDEGGMAALSAAGVPFAVEGWPGAAQDIASLPGKGVAYLKLATHRLLEREKPRRGQVPVLDIAEAAHAAGLTIIATGVSSDEDAVSLIDLGIDLMLGELFSGPRRLKSGDEQAPRAVGV